MAEPVAPVEPARVRSIPIRRDESFFVRQEVIERPNGAVQVEDLRLLRGPLRDLLELQLYFTIKLKFQMEYLEEVNPFGDGAVRQMEPYFLKPAPWVVEPEANPELRLQNIIEVARDKLEEHLESARRRGSRDNIGGMLRVYCLTTPGEAMARLPPAPAVPDEPAGAYVKLPAILANMKCLWNPQTGDGSSCFAWCVRGALLEVDKMSYQERRNMSRLTDKKFFVEERETGWLGAKRRKTLVARNFGYDFSPLPTDRGTTWADIQVFEQANGFRLRFYVWRWQEVQWQGRRYFERQLIRQPATQDFPAEKEINLLRHEGHYCLIWNFAAFNSGRGAMMDGSQRTSHKTMHVCHRCRSSFSSAEVLRRHQSQPCEPDPVKRKGSIRMPEVKKLEHLVNYRPGPAEEFAPLALYADLEIESELAPAGQVGEHTHSIQQNVLSAAYLAVGRSGYQPGRRSFLTVREEGEDKFAAVERLLTSMREEGERYLLWKRRVNIPARLTREQQLAFDASANCERCGVRYEPGHEYKTKVCHHQHGTGRFLGAVCKSCNSRVVQPRMVSVVLHNGGSYDFRFLIRAVAELRRKSLKGEGCKELDEAMEAKELESEDEELKSEFEEQGEQSSKEEESIAMEDVSTEVEKKSWCRLPFSVLYKSGEKILSFRLGCLRFIDSMNFYKAPLSGLMDELRLASPNDPSKVFVQMAQLHPELQPSALTPERRRNLRRFFAPERELTSVTEDEFKQFTWKLLLRKLPMPFERMVGPEVWNMPAVWDDVEAYQSTLSPLKPEALRLKVKELRDACQVLGLRTFRQVHDTYLFMDLSLADVMENFRGMFHTQFGLDPLQKISLPGAAFDAMRRACLCRRSVRLVVERGIYDVLREGMMGGLSCIFNPRRRANSPELGEHYDATKPTSYIAAMDVSSMYPSIMREGLPTTAGKHLELPATHLERLRWLSERVDSIDFNNHDESVAYVFVVDYSFPLSLHDRLDWAPPRRMKVGKDQLSPYTLELMRKNNVRASEAEKLVPFLGAHVKEAVDGKRLAFMVKQMGAKIDKLHTAIIFECRRFLKPWIEKCYRARLELKSKGLGLEADLLKLVMNAMYGKLIQRYENNSTSLIYTEPAKFVRAANGSRMQDLDVFSTGEEFVGVVHRVQSKPVLQKSMVQIGFRVLELSRLMLMQIHYLGIKMLFPQALPLSTDTDSITYYIETERDPLLQLAEANEVGGYPCFFDLAKDLVGKPQHSWVLDRLTPQQQATAWKRAGELGGFGWENLPVRIVEHIGLRAKLYSLLFSKELKGKTSKQRAKGVMKKVMPGHGEYRQCLEEGREQEVSFAQMVSRQYYMAVEPLRKNALSPYNDKIFQLDENSGRPLGHWRNCKELEQLVKMLDPEGRPFQLVMMYLKGTPDRPELACELA